MPESEMVARKEDFEMGALLAHNRPDAGGNNLGENLRMSGRQERSGTGVH